MLHSRDDVGRSEGPYGARDDPSEESGCRRGAVGDDGSGGDDRESGCDSRDSRRISARFTERLGQSARLTFGTHGRSQLQHRDDDDGSVGRNSERRNLLQTGVQLAHKCVG